MYYWQYQHTLRNLGDKKISSKLLLALLCGDDAVKKYQLILPELPISDNRKKTRTLLNNKYDVLANLFGNDDKDNDNDIKIEIIAVEGDWRTTRSQDRSKIRTGLHSNTIKRFFGVSIWSPTLSVKWTKASSI